jgi:hypothetical protein
MTLLEPLPLSLASLERYRIKSRRQKQATLTGSHQMRRKGQSLEFYDFRPYIPGDDIRHVDWRASARRGSGANFRNLLVKNFTAEEQMTLVISIDTRDSMQMPHVMPKILIAAWLAEAISRIAIRSDDQIVLHRLFGRGDIGIESLRGSTGLSRIREVLKRLNANKGSKDSINLGVLDRYLPPSAVWLIITDFYFDMGKEAKKLANRIVKAQDGWRWIISMDLDSWPYEKTYMGIGARKINGPGLLDPNQQYEITPQTIQEIENRIKSHKNHFRKLVTREAYDHICWEWPEAQPEPRDFFQHRFGEEKILQRLFMKGKG